MRDRELFRRTRNHRADMVLYSKLQGAKSTVGGHPMTRLENLPIQEAEVGNGGILSTRNLYRASTTGRKT